MNVGIDMDATITELPEFFALLAKALRSAGHRVFVVSFREPGAEAATEAELMEMGIPYDRVVHPTSREDLAEFKGRAARELDLDIFFDDTPEAFNTMPPTTKRLWLIDPRIYNMPAVIERLGLNLLRF